MGGDGYDIIYQRDTDYTVNSKRLADCLSVEYDKLNNRHKIFTRGATKDPTDDYHSILATNFPMIISELAFIDTKDVQVVDTYQEQNLEAQALYKMFLKYFKLS